jgi:hypothetical protein
MPWLENLDHAQVPVLGSCLGKKTWTLQKY